MTEKLQFARVLLAECKIRVAKRSAADSLCELGAAPVCNIELLFTDSVVWALLKQQNNNDDNDEL